MPARKPPEPVDIQGVHTQAMDRFIGYSVRRASVAVIDNFVRRMAAHDLRPVTFTLLMLADSNPGITSSQLCALLAIQSSNLVGLVKQLLDRGLITRQPHPNDGRAMGLHLTPAGRALLKKAGDTAAEADLESTARLTDAERQTLTRLLRKVYE